MGWGHQRRAPMLVTAGREIDCAQFEPSQYQPDIADGTIRLSFTARTP